MPTYIKSFRLLNFQSWNNSSPSIDLCTDTLNIIEGPNETGKSVFFKAFYNMVFPGYWSAAELIRRGYTTAAMVLALADDSQVLYTLERGHYAVILQDSNGEEHAWRDYSLFPTELINHLGLVVDFNSKVILNIIDKDVPLPFIKSSPTLNASHFKAIVEPQDITEFFESLKVKLSDTEYARSLFSRAATNTYSAASVLDFVDINKLHSDLSFVNASLFYVKECDNLLDCMSTILEKVDKRPVEVKSPETVCCALDLYDKTRQIASLLHTLINNQRYRPKQVVNPEGVTAHLATFDAIKRIGLQVQTVHKQISSKPLAVSSPESAKPMLTAFDLMRTLMSSLSKASDHIHAQPNRITLPDIDSELSTLTSCSSCLDCLNVLIMKHEEISKLVEKQQYVSSELKKIRDTVGVCPTCGRLLEEDANDTCFHNT